MSTRAVLLALALAAAAAVPAAAQGRWKEIGRTSSGNPVYVDPRSVKRHGDRIDAAVRVVFRTPVKARKGLWVSSRTTATFECSTRKLAASENVYYADAAGTRVTERTVNRIPGYGAALGGSLGAAALDWLCSAKK